MRLIWAHNCDEVDGVGKFQPMGTILSYAFSKSEFSSLHGNMGEHCENQTFSLQTPNTMDWPPVTPL